MNGAKLLRPDRYEECVTRLKDRGFEGDPSELGLYRIHPSFRVIALAKPPKGRGGPAVEELLWDENKRRGGHRSVKKNANDRSGVGSSSAYSWLSTETLSLFSFRSLPRLSAEESRQLIAEVTNDDLKGKSKRAHNNSALSKSTVGTCGHASRYIEST